MSWHIPGLHLAQYKLVMHALFYITVTGEKRCSERMNTHIPWYDVLYIDIMAILLKTYL